MGNPFDLTDEEEDKMFTEMSLDMGIEDTKRIIWDWERFAKRDRERLRKLEEAQKRAKVEGRREEKRRLKKLRKAHNLPIVRSGYVFLRIRKDNRYHSMGNNGFIAEHRLRVAEALGRCLESWEIVHHRNGNKLDNRIENLTIYTQQAHFEVTVLQNEIRRLRKENRWLKGEVQRISKCD